MRVLTFQSDKLDLSFKNNDKIFADENLCNYPNAKEIYKRLFEHYNKQKNTEYKSFFWAFSNLCTDNRTEQIQCAKSIIGDVSTKNAKLLILEVPDELCLATDFFNFSDEIFAYEFPNELESLWDTIFITYEDRESQVIFPYISQEMIVEIIEEF